MRHSIFSATLLLLGIAAVVAGAAAATLTPRAAIQAQYDQGSEAARLKFIDGMELYRAPEFVETSPVGQKVEPIREHDRLRQLFATALSVKETVHILSFHQIDANHAACRVDDVVDMVSLDRAIRQPTRVVLESVSEDRWARGAYGWQETARRLTEQTTKREPLPVPAIPAAKSNPGK